LHSNWDKYSGRVRLCGTKNCKFKRFPKVLELAKPPGVVGGCKKLSKRMAMQSNCSGSSRDLRAKRIVRGRPGAERGEESILNSRKLLQEQENVGLSIAK
jgi:hypothetical protein